MKDKTILLFEADTGYTNFNSQEYWDAFASWKAEKQVVPEHTTDAEHETTGELLKRILRGSYTPGIDDVNLIKQIEHLEANQNIDYDMTDVELKPCPFCGGEATIFEKYKGLYNVGCNTCDATIDPDERTKESCIEAWNSRTK